MARLKTDFKSIKCSKCFTTGLDSKNALRERKNGIETGNWLCRKCYQNCGPKKPTDFKNVKCYFCGKTDLTSKTAIRAKYVDMKLYKEWICINCYQNDYYRKIVKNDPNSLGNIMKLLSDRRTGNQDPNSNNVIGDKSQKLINTLKNLKCINEDSNNYNNPIDSIDIKTGLKYQIKGKLYSIIRRYWSVGILNEFAKKYKSIFIVCLDSHGNIVERIYEIPKTEIDVRCLHSITITKNPIRNNSSRTISWYDIYRITDNKEIEKANEIWKKIK